MTDDHDHDQTYPPRATDLPAPAPPLLPPPAVTAGRVAAEPLAEENLWITSQDVAEWLGAMATDQPRLDDATAAARWYVQMRRSELGLDVAGAEAPPDVKLGTIIYAALIYQQRSSPTGFAAYGDGAVDVPGDSSQAYMRAMRLIGLRRPVAI